MKEISAIPYLLSSLIAAESDPVPINATFALLSAADIGKKYGALYSTMQACWKRHKLIEPAGLWAEIAARYDCGNHRKNLTEQLNLVWSGVASSELWQHYLKLALAEVKISKLKALGQDVYCKDISSIEIDAILQQAKNDIGGIMDRYSQSQNRDLSDILAEHMHSFDQEASGHTVNAVQTGMGYERHINGLRAGDYVIIAGRPKMGKSAFALTMMANALYRGKRVLYAINEMDEMSVVRRFIAHMSDIRHTMLRNPERASEADVRMLIETTERLQKLPLHIYSYSLKTPAAIHTETQRLADAGTPVDVIVADYMQLFRTGATHRTKYEEVTELSWQFKMLAVDTGIPVVALSQLNRSCEARENKRPVVSDLRESGALEQDATAVMLLYRDDAYYPDSNEPGIAEVNTAINRNGTTGTTKYMVDFEHMSFQDVQEKGGYVE